MLRGYDGPNNVYRYRLSIKEMHYALDSAFRNQVDW